MQTRSYEQEVPLSLPMNEAYSTEKKAYSENLSDGSLLDSFYDSLTELHPGAMDGDLSTELSDFLSQDEINKSLDLAREAFSGSSPRDFSPEPPGKRKSLNLSPLTPSPNKSARKPKETESSTTEKVHDGCPMPTATVGANSKSAPTPQTCRNSSPAASEIKTVITPLLTTRPSLIRSLQAKSSAAKHGPNSSNTTLASKAGYSSDANSQNEISNKAANFIEELSSIFRDKSKTRGRSPDGNSSSPDSGYLSPKNHQTPHNIATVINAQAKPQQNAKPEAKPPSVIPVNSSSENKEQITLQEQKVDIHQVETVQDPPVAPRFTQKLKSQEVDEGSMVRLECRVFGNPAPQAR